MATINKNDLLEQLQWRYATKAFDPNRRIPAKTMAAIEESLVLTPSSFGLQPWKFLVVSDDSVKAKLPSASWEQQQPKDCSHLVVFAQRTGFTRADVGRFIERMAEVREVSADSLSGYEQFAGGFVERAAQAGWIDAWAKNQVYIALGQLMLAASLLGVDACPMEGIQPQAYDKILGLDGEAFTTVVACALGYRAEDDKYATATKVRYARDEVIERV